MPEYNFDNNKTDELDYLKAIIDGDFKSLPEEIKETLEKDLKRFRDFAKKCEFEKTKTFTSLVLEDSRKEWCIKALLNALTSVYIVGKLYLSPPAEDVEITTLITEDERVSELVTSYLHISQHIMEYISLIEAKTLNNVISTRNTKEVAILKDLYAK